MIVMRAIFGVCSHSSLPNLDGGERDTKVVAFLFWKDVVHGGQLEDFVGRVFECIREASLQTGRQFIQEETRVVVDELVAYLTQHWITVEQVLHIELTAFDLNLDDQPLDAHVLLAVLVVAFDVQFDTCTSVF